MIQVFRIDQNGFFIEPVLVENAQEIPVDCVGQMPPDGLYKAQFVNGAWIEGKAQADILIDIKNNKKISLSLQCNLAIMSGFTSEALGNVHTYPSDFEAQLNFNSTMNRFMTDSSFTQIQFKTLDSGYLTHNKEQFFKVFADGHTYGDQQIAHLNDLKAKVDAAQTIDEVNSISW